MISDKGIHRLSFIISVGLHLVILFVPFIKHQMVKNEVAAPAIPIEFTVEEVLIESPKKIHSSVAKSKKPKRLPGDRSRAIISKRIEPFYPKDAINFGFEGRITVLATISPAGKITRIKVLHSTGHDILDNAFIAALKQSYRFKPKRILGVNKTDKIKLTYHFTL